MLINPASPTNDSLVDRIVGSSKRCQLVIAAAGSGKTRLLVNVLSNRIDTGKDDPTKHNVIVFTFTNNAADELVVRLSTALGQQKQELLNHIFVGTIHSWCNEYLKDQGLLSNTKVIDELERAQLVQRIYGVLGLKELYEGVNQFNRIDKFLRDLELFYNEGLQLADTRIPRNVKTAITRYLDFIRNQRLMDFGYLIRETTIKLSTGAKESCPLHVYVDEYQDVNPAQVNLFKAMVMSNSSSRLFAVGDPRQSIYQWRGSDVSRIVCFNEDFPDSELSSMNTNYRSRTGIVNFANTVAGDMRFPSTIEIEDMKCSRQRSDDNESVIVDVESRPHEESVVYQVTSLIDSGVKPRDIAILLRSVINHGQGLMDCFRRANIPFSSPNWNAGTQFVQDLMGSVIELIKFIHEPPTPSNMEEEKEIQEKVDNCLDRIRRYCEMKDPPRIHLAISDWHKELGEDRGRYHNERYNFRRQFFDFCRAVGLTIDPKSIDIQEGFAAITQIMKAIEEAYRRRLLHGYNLRSSPYEVFVGNLRWALNNQLERWAETGMNMNQDGVTVSTVHAAKGLEWPVVILPFAWKGRFPLRQSGHGTSFPDSMAQRYGTTVEDEKRLWYVAVTRARDRLYVFCGPDQGHPKTPFVYEDTLGSRKNICLVPSHDGHEFSRIEAFTRPTYFHVGVSDFLLLLECPFSFYLRKIVSIDVPVGEELGAGNVLHRVIERLAQGEDSSKIDSIIIEEVYLPLAEEEHERRMRRSIKKRVTDLIRSGLLKSIDFTEYRFVFQLDNLVVSGIVDATRKLGSSIELIDWKYTVHDEFKVRYVDQLRVYAYGLRQLGMNVTKATLFDLSQKGLGAREQNIDISDNEVNSTMSNALQSLRRLLQSGPYKLPSETSCTICDVSLLCKDSRAKKGV